jgi:tetratricopeptide (TPR) repeat protein
VYPALSPEIRAELEPIALATLRVESVPDHANVFLDEAFRGTTPLHIPNVEAGRHVLRVEKNHVYQPVMKEVELKEGETLAVTVPLDSNLENYYLARIKESPKKLSNYTEFVHLHVLNNAPEKAVDVILQAVAALKGGEAKPSELARFTSEVSSVYGGSAGPLDDATRKKFLDGLVDLFEQVAGTADVSYATYTPIASLLIQAGRTKDVLAVCDRLGDAGKRPGYLHYQIGRAIAKTAGSATALAILARSIELNPKYYPAHYYVGTIHHRNGNLDKAMASYQEAEKLLSKGSSSYYQGLVQYNIARVLAAKGDVAGATARFEKALAVKTSPAYVNQWRLDYAQFLATNGKKAEAIKQYTELRRTATSSTHRYAAIKALKRLGVTPKKKD